jgi:hypothetical protein
MPEFQVQAEMHLDKNDIVAIAVAEAEKKIREQLTFIKTRIHSIEEDIEKSDQVFVCDGESLLKRKIGKKIKDFSAKVSALGFGLEAEIDIDVMIDQVEELTNNYLLSICGKDGTRMKIISKSFPATKVQLDIKDQKTKMHEQKAKLLGDGVKWRSKQSDIPALERQMRAKIARAQLEKSKGGQSILKSMLKNLDDTVNLIGM